MKYKIVPAFTFDFLTPFYDSITDLIGFGESFKRKVIRMTKLQDGESLLDIGCGTGSLLILTKQDYPNSKVVGIDPDQRVLDIARRKIEKAKVEVDLIKAYSENLPFNPSSFDIVVSTLVFHHLPTEIKKQTIKEAHRVLKKNGRFFLADFGKPDNAVWKVILALESIFEEAKYMKDNLDGKLPIFLEEAGFKVKDIPPKYRGIQFILATKP